MKKLVIGILVALLNLMPSAGWAALYSFSNSGQITINNGPAFTAATPYPSTINVTGVSGVISKLTIKLNKITHPYPDDIIMLLVGPTGAQLVVVSDCGGINAISGVSLTLDDDASNQLPNDSLIPTGTYRPTSVNSGLTKDSFPAPAPSAPYTFAAPFGSATLGSVFEGTNPNGTWRLYVADDSMGPQTAYIAEGWGLDIITGSAEATTTVLASSLNPSFTTAPNNSATFTATVTSGGSPVTTGSVTFKEGASVLAGPTALDASGQASFSISSLSEGDHTITAQYGGSASLFAVSSGSLSQRVDHHTAVSGNTFHNPGNLAILESAPPYPAVPYPSRIFVSGLSGTISKVTVSLHNLTHSWPDDMDLLLVGPNGAKLILMSDAGGATAVNNITLTLDDSGGSMLPDGGPLSSGTFQPASVSSGAAETFPAPAPAGPYLSAAPQGTASLSSSFNGSDPNGTWSLFVITDSAGQPAGSIAGGWSLAFTTSGDAATVTTLASSLNPSFATTPNNAVTFTANVTSGGSPVTEGSVTFKEGITVLSGPTALNSEGLAEFTISTLSEGHHLVTAEYGGSPGAFNVSSGNLTQTVDNHTVVNGNDFSNPGTIAIQNMAAPAPAAVYPSRIFVSGRPGTLARLSVQLRNLTHPAPDELDLLLVGPTGAAFVLMSDVGGLTTPANNVTLMLDDLAASSLPNDGSLSSGNFKPTSASSSSFDSFPGPAPSSGYLFAAPEGTSTLASAFNGTVVNGIWSLYVVDDSIGPIGQTASLAGGWLLTILTTPGVLSVSSDLSDGAYTAGQVIPISITFDQAVTVTGTPQLALETGDSDAVADYASGSGTMTLIFHYTVAAGHTSADLDILSTTSLTLNGGAIRSGTIDASLTLPPPGEAGSLGANKDLVIDTTSPSISVSAPSVATTASGPVVYTVTYEDAHFQSSSLAESAISLNITETASASTLEVTGSGSTWTVTLSGITGCGSLGISIEPGTGMDAAGNLAPAAGPSATFIVNHPPVAGADTIQRYATQGVKVSLAALLANDSDEDADALSFGTVNPSSPGGASLTRQGGWIYYAPPADLAVADTFTYTVNDTRGGTATGTVTVNIFQDDKESNNKAGIINLGEGKFRIIFDGIPGRTYTIQFTTDLGAPLWQNLGTALADSSGIYTFDDSEGSVSRFYRSVYP